MRKEWTELEVLFLIENYPKYGRNYCGDKLNRTIASTRRKADSMGIKLNKDARSRLSKEGTEQANKARIKDRVNEKSINFQGYEMLVIKSDGAKNLTIQFNDAQKSIRHNVSYREFIKGSVKNLYHSDIFGVGYFGEGSYTARVEGKMSKCYTTWINMLNRCYNKLNHKQQTTYKDVIVCEEWYNFQNFAKWFYENFKPHMQHWQLDKDLICFSCKIYSPETCSLLPSEINVIFQNQILNESTGIRGVYKEGNKYVASISKFGKQCYLGIFDTLNEAKYAYNTAKKDYLKEVSDNWRNVLSDKICDAIRDFDINFLNNLKIL
jgi:hypothetical protein